MFSSRRPTGAGRALAEAVGALVFAGACGGGGGSVPSMITVAGHVLTWNAVGGKPLAGANVAIYQSTGLSPVGSMATDNSGGFSIVVSTGGNAFDGYAQVTKQGYVDAYFQPEAPWTEDDTAEQINTTNALDQLDSACGVPAVNTTFTLFVEARDRADNPIVGAMTSIMPNATPCYLTGGVPSTAGTETDSSGLSIYFNVTGTVSVDASAGATIFNSHSVPFRSNTVTTTVVGAQ